MAWRPQHREVPLMRQKSSVAAADAAGAWNCDAHVSNIRFVENMITRADFEDAQRRIAKATRRTPMLAAGVVPEWASADVTLKLELLQVTGSFKARGAINKAGMLTIEETRRGVITASGGNHGLAVAYAAHVLGVPATIYLPANVHPDKVAKLKNYGAKVVIEGASWHEANRGALAAAEKDELAYIHPFADPQVIAGQGTIALEILADAPDTEIILVAIGGGGLISGVALAAKALKPSIRIIGIEPVGAATLHESLRAGKIVTLPALATEAVTLAANRTEDINFAAVSAAVEEIVLVSDEEMRDAARLLWSQFGLAAELSGAASVAALMTGRVTGERICALVCGAGRDGMA